MLPLELLFLHLACKGTLSDPQMETPTPAALPVLPTSPPSWGLTWMLGTLLLSLLKSASQAWNREVSKTGFWKALPMMQH